MPAFDVLDALVRGGNGVLRTADAVAAGGSPGLCLEIMCGNEVWSV